MTNSSAVMRFDTLLQDNFKAIIRPLVGNREHFVTLFTDDVRAMWFDTAYISNGISEDQWRNFPCKDIDTNSAIMAMADFARAGIGFDFVKNKYFESYIKIVAPGYDLPSMQDLIECW